MSESCYPTSKEPVSDDRVIASLVNVARWLEVKCDPAAAAVELRMLADRVQQRQRDAVTPPGEQRPHAYLVTNPKEPQLPAEVYTSSDQAKVAAMRLYASTITPLYVRPEPSPAALRPGLERAIEIVSGASVLDGYDAVREFKDRLVDELDAAIPSAPPQPPPAAPTECPKHGPHTPGECPQCDELAEARSIVATTFIPPAPEPYCPRCSCKPCSDRWLKEKLAELHPETKQPEPPPRKCLSALPGCLCKAHPKDGSWLDINCPIHGNRYRGIRPVHAFEHYVRGYIDGASGYIGEDDESVLNATARQMAMRYIESPAPTKRVQP